MFVGRERELDELCDAWERGAGGVVALVGLGGAGKTALVARFLRAMLDQGREGLTRPEGLFVWSFYQQPDAGMFLQEAHRYFAGDAAAASPARGTGLLHLLREALSGGERHLLVLDGLERVQNDGPGGDGRGHGRVEDPLLRGLLTRIAEGSGRTTALVTSRFPLTDLEPFRGRGYRLLDVGGLERESAVDLLRRRGVVGDDAALAALVDSYGAHALTIDHLGGLIGRFLGGDPRRAPEAPTLTTPGGDRQALRLARLLRAYEEHLSPAELALLCRLCLLRNSVTEEQVVRLFVCSPAVQVRDVREAGEQVGRVSEPWTRPEEEPLGLAQATVEVIERALAAAPLAGPTDGFAPEVFGAVARVVSDWCWSDVDLDEFVAQYRAVAQDPPTDRWPLSEMDRGTVALMAAYRELHQSLGTSPQAPQHHDALKEAFEQLGWGVPEPSGQQGPKGPGHDWDVYKATLATGAEGRTPEDLAPEGGHYIESHRRVEQKLRRLALKHAVLVRVCEVCRVRQRKWALAGPLAAFDADAVRRALAELAERHLVLREADGSVGVHPAVRDHFARLGERSDGGGSHDLIREQLVSLARRPGRGLPEDKATLDLVEEAIHHALEAGREAEARELYEHGLGGLRHLGWKLGDSARGLRVLRGFSTCPDRSALGWFLRSLGELDEAYRANPMPFFRADVRLLQGRLPEVAAEGDPARTAAAAFLMGERFDLPPDLLGMAVPRAHLLLFLGRLRQAWQEPWLDRFYGDIGWEGDRARLRLLLAEVVRRLADPEGCRRELDAASAWVLRSGSVEHLCLWHLVRARAERDFGDLKAARRAADEGVHTASQCGLGLYHVLLLNARAEILLRADDETAEHSAREALARASDPSCRFGWGESEAGHLLGQALAARWNFGEARAVLADTLALRRRIGDPGADRTAALLERLPS
jgi:hypothetical protein